MHKPPPSMLLPQDVPILMLVVLFYFQVIMEYFLEVLSGILFLFCTKTVWQTTYTVIKFQYVLQVTLLLNIISNNGNQNCFCTNFEQSGELLN